MNCLVCNNTSNIQIVIGVKNDLLLDPEPKIKKFCYRCMYVISKAYNNLLQGNVSNLQEFHAIQEMVDGDL